MRIWQATRNSWRGLRFAYHSERAFREELIALVVALPLATLIGVTAARRFEMIGAILLIMIVELLNTAIEKLADRLTRERDSQIGAVKDLSSAAVGVSLVIACAVWMFATAEKFGLI